MPIELFHKTSKTAVGSSEGGIGSGDCGDIDDSVDSGDSEGDLVDSGGGIWGDCVGVSCDRADSGGEDGSEGDIIDGGDCDLIDGNSERKFFKKNFL